MLKPKFAVVVAALALVALGWLGLRRSPPPTSAQPDPPVAEESALPTPRPQKRSLPPPGDRTRFASGEVLSTNFLGRLLNGESLPVTLEQLTTYLQANHRNADSLLAAYQATGERALLDEALTNYPHDPRVAYHAWFRAPAGPDDPEATRARRQALDVLKEAAPDNALVNYLSARNYFASGQPELAIQEMQTGAAKPDYDDYTRDAMQSMTEAYLAAGYSEAEAKLAANSGALLPHLADLKQDGVRLAELAKSYQQAGDSPSAQAMLQLCQDLGQRLDDRNSTTLIQQLVGIAVQRIGLDAAAAMPADPANSQAIQDRVNALTQERQDIKALVAGHQIETWLQTASPQDVVAFCDRERAFGEAKALQWLANRNANP